MKAICAACRAAWAGGVAAGEEVDLQDLTEGEAEADERTEGADVEERDDPRVAELQCGAHGPQVGLLVTEVVHEQGGAERGDGAQDQVDRADDPGSVLPMVAMTSRPISWTAGTPMFPPPALSPSAQPFRRCG